MKIETFFQDLAWTEKLFDHDERRQNVFNMLKPFVDKDDLELAIAMGDPTLIIPIWIGRSRQTLKKKKKTKLKKALSRILSSQRAPIPVSTQLDPSSSGHNKRVPKLDAQPNDVVTPNQHLTSCLPDLEPIIALKDPDEIMEDVSGLS